MMNAFSKRIIYSLELFAIILVCLLFATYYNIKRADSRELWVNHSDEVFIHIGRVQILAAESEIQARNYVMSGHPIYVKQFKATNAAVIRQLDTVKNFTIDNASIQPVIDSLSFYLAKRIFFYQRVINLFGKNGFQNAVEFIQGGEGQVYGNKTTYFINKIEQNENSLMALRKADSGSALLMLNVSLVVTVVFILAMIMMLLRKAHNESLVHNRLVADLINNNERNKRAEEMAVLGTWDLDMVTGKINGSEGMYRI
ncbi:CHASE3 domain-containing protein [Mucilaginibacter terrae]|uniref:CHASE3 domain-containing protein n=1 Tax=Mucilaginibacter terrae TaxID=1955052 RepID=UPI00362DFBE3